MACEALGITQAKAGSTGSPGVRRSGRRRSWPVLKVFIGIVTVQLLVAVISIDVMFAVRAYVTGESLYSKGQKDTHINLVEHAEHFRDEDCQKLLSALAMPIGDRIAREALQKSPPDKEAARRGLLAGGGGHAGALDPGGHQAFPRLAVDAVDGRRGRDLDPR